MRDNKRDYLTLTEILNIQHPEYYKFTFTHIGNLFLLDANKDGRISLSELENFALFC